jgi:anthranilate phosphoribosyltransferase
MNIAPLIRRAARGKHGAENLTRDEARLVMQRLMQPDADALQLGAFLIAQRMKGETPAELAGFVEAARTHIDGYGKQHAPAGCVDLPCYAGKRRAAPVHLAAALKVRDEGIPVFVHGVEHIDGRISAWDALQHAGVRRASDLQQAAVYLQQDGIVYADLGDICPPLFTIFGLRPRLGVRTFANTVARLLNPLACQGQLNGFFHTPYAQHMTEANKLLGQPRSLVFMGAEGDPELYADRQKVLLAQEAGSSSALAFPEAGASPYPREALESPESLLQQFAALLRGETDAREAVVLQRMHEAFTFASKGVLPSEWQREVYKP